MARRKYLREAIITYKRSTAKVTRVTSSRDVVPIVRELIPDGPAERLIVLGLDSKGMVISWHLAGVGGLSSVGVEPGSIFRWALLAGVSSIILAHNHPSGDPTPSPEDVALTARVVEVGELVGLRVLDHVIVGEGEGYFSLLDSGLMGGK
jgi:DNA repair protein RadC